MMIKKEDEVLDSETINEVSLQDMNNLISESQNLLKNLYNMTNVQKIKTQDDLRNDISSFVSSQLKNLEQQNVLKGLLEAEIAKRVLTHEMSNDELRSFYATISSEKSRNIDSLFKLFVPTQSTPSIILTPATKEDTQPVIEMSPSQRQAIEKLSRIMSTINNKEGKQIDGE